MLIHKRCPQVRFGLYVIYPYIWNMKTKTARFEARWTPKQKQLFEKASVIGGFKSLSEFVLYTIQRQAEEIIEKHEKFLSSKRDQKIFADALLNPPAPNSKLKKAATKYLDSIENNVATDRTARVKA